MFTERDINFLTRFKYTYDGEEMTFLDIYREYLKLHILNEYPFDEWFIDNVDLGFIKVLQ